MVVDLESTFDGVDILLIGKFSIYTLDKILNSSFFLFWYQLNLFITYSQGIKKMKYSHIRMMFLL